MKNALKTIFKLESSWRLITTPEFISSGKAPTKWLKLIQLKDTKKNTWELIQSLSSKILIMKDMHKFTSIQSISSAKMEEKKSPKSSMKENLSTKLYSIPPSKTKYLPSQIKALKTGNYKKILHLSLMNLPKSINFKIFTLILITNHTLSALKPTIFYAGKSHNNAQSTTSPLKK